MASPPPTPLVELRNLSFGYGERVTLNNVSLTVPRGKVGASSGGKTTILRLIGGQNRAQTGQMLFDGQDVTVMDRDNSMPHGAAWACCTSLERCLPT